VLRRRAVAQHLHERLPRGAVAVAARGGLQDSAPRSGLLALHARVGGVDPAAWEDDDLVQVWGPRMAVYLVPRSDAHVFTLGRSPRDPDAMARLQAMGERAAAVDGRVQIRWDTRTTVTIPVDPGDVDVEEARLELARRFLAWLGPATSEQYAKWAGVEERDAVATWDALGARRELATVTLGRHDRSMLAADVDALCDGDRQPAIRGVRLLPMGDPYLARDRALLVRDKHEYAALFRPQKYLPGAILLDGRLAGTWSRQQHRVTLRPWVTIAGDDAARVEEEAHSFSGPLGRSPDVRWVAP
jgi:hypothetical protein